MACSRPRTAYRCADGSLSFVERRGVDAVSPLYLPCRKCVMCRAQWAREHQTRLIQEAACWPRNVCATLTVADEHLDALGSVSKRDWQLFLKRLRFAVSERTFDRIRSDVVSEYSPVLKRPHYHSCLFNYWPPDAVFWNKSRAGNPQWTSEELMQAWGLGHVTFQDFSSAAAGYCARHQAEKLFGQKARDFLAVHAADGSLVGHREPEFHLCSTHPGLGARFFEKYGAQMLAHDFTVVGGRKVPLPAYYLRLAERVDPGRVADLKALHELAAQQHAEDATYARLAVREQVAAAKVRSMARDGVDRG